MTACQTARRALPEAPAQQALHEQTPRHCDYVSLKTRTMGNSGVIPR